MRRLAAATLLACWACGQPEPATPRGVVRTADSLRAVATELRVAGTIFTAEVEAWRSFQPLVGAPGDPLIAVVRVRGEGGARIPGALAIDSVWLVRGADVVQGTASEEQPRDRDARTVEFVLRDGPRWPPGDSIDVIVALSGVGAPVPVVRAPRVAIARVD